MAHDPAAPVATAPPPDAPDNLRGIAFMAIGFALFSTSDLLAKLATGTMSPFQVAWARQIGLALAVIVLLARRGLPLLRTRYPGLQLLRGATTAVSASCFIVALVYVPLAGAVAVTFVTPFIVILLGALVLGETVSARRWIAVAAGFLGTLIVIRPGAGAFHPAILFAVVSATAFALRQVISRYLAGTDPIATTIAYTGLTSTVLVSLTLPFVWISPQGWREVALMAAIGIVAGVGELMIMRALDIASAAVVSPLHYTTILWATLWGYLVFGQLPDGWTWLGTVIVVASGLYSLYRDARRR